MQPISYIVSAIALLYVNSSVLAADSSQSDSCTSGFMSQERMDALLLRLNDHTGVGRTAVLTNEFAQGIFPGINFTCNGNIQSLIFGAKWTDGSNQSFPELQIWRLRETESYIKVRSALINVPRENASKLYWYNLTSPLSFEAGDILGYYQPDISTCQLALYFDHQAEGGYSAHFYGIIILNESSHLVGDLKTIPSVQPLLDVHVVTDYIGSSTSTTGHRMVSSSSTSVMPTTSHPIVSATSSTSILSSQVLTHESSVEAVPNIPIDPVLSLVTTRTMAVNLKPLTSHDHMMSTTMSSWTNEQHLPMGSVTRLASISSPHEGSDKGRSGGIYIATVTAVVVLVTVVVIIAAILVCVLQQRRSKMAVDVQHTAKESVENPIYADKQQRKAVELHHKDDQTNTNSMENLVYAEMQQRNAVEVHHKERTNKDSVENTVYEGIQQRESEMVVEVRHKEQADKDSVENSVYEGIQQRESKTAVEVHHKEQTNKNSVENPVYEGMQQRGSKKTVEVHHKEQTNNNSVENLV